jgi:hypothetical protein
MNSLKLCCLVAALGALVAAPAAMSDHHENKEDAAHQGTEADDAATGKASASIGPGLQRLVDVATLNLAANLKVEPEVIEVVEAEFVTWRDSSAGCPRPGMQYLQVLTNGARIVLQVNGTSYHYHSGGSRPPFYCAEPSPTRPLPYSHGET